MICPHTKQICTNGCSRTTAGCLFIQKQMEDIYNDNVNFKNNPKYPPDFVLNYYHQRLSEIIEQAGKLTQRDIEACYELTKNKFNL